MTRTAVAVLKMISENRFRTSSDLASLKTLPSPGSGSPCVDAYLSRDHSPNSPASSPLMPLSLCHRLVAVAVLSPKYPVGSSSR